MRIFTPLRVMIVCAFLVAALALVVMEGHLGTHAAAPAKAVVPAKVSTSAAAGIAVHPGKVIELSSGSFATTIYGQELVPHQYYKLTDNNTSCQDSLRLFPNVQTDLNGRFAYPLVSFSSSSPCRAGTYTVKAVGPGGTYKDTFTLSYAKVLPTNASVLPKSVVSLSDGSFAVVISIQGLLPATTYDVSDDTVGCVTSYNGGGTFTFTTDAEGNAALTLVGGPGFFVGSGPCTPATNTEVVSVPGGNNVAEAVWTLLPAHR